MCVGEKFRRYTYVRTFQWANIKNKKEKTDSQRGKVSQK